MSVYFEHGRGWVYEFRYKGVRHRPRRGFRVKQTAADAERKLRDDLQRAAAGLPPSSPSVGTSPRIVEWAGVYLAWVQRQARLGNIRRPDRIEELLTVVLRFWGAPPATPDRRPPAYPTPYHDLRLDDPIRDPSWLTKWDEWLDARRIANSTINHYNTTMARLYWLALQLEHRAQTGISLNPFAGRPRARGRRRTATVSPAQLGRWLQHASYHARLALSIAALAHKLRLQNILQLEWRQVDFAQRVITVAQHKTDKSAPPLLVPITPKLAAVLRAARKRAPTARHVVTYRGAPVKTIDTAIKNAAAAAGLAYGRDTADGVTFHTLRHAVNTWLARAGTDIAKQKAASGHERLETTLWYSHLNLEDQRPVYNAVAARLPANLAALVKTAPIKIARRRMGGHTGGPGSPPGGESGRQGAGAGARARRQTKVENRRKRA